MGGAGRQLRRILLTADTVGGVWTYAVELAAALEPHGLEVVLATMGGPARPGQRAAVARLPHVRLCASDYRLEWMDNPWADVAAAGTWLLALARETRPDVVHLNGYAHANLPWAAPVLVVGHSCVYSWFEAVHGTSPPAAWRPYHAAVQRGLQAADLVTAPTRAMLDALARHYRPFNSCGALANGRRANGFAARPKAPLILTAGRFWDEAKNLATLDRAAATLEWPVYAAGATRLGERAAARARGLITLGELAPDTLAEWCARAAVFALPACYEPFGLAALEAGLAGCALVLGDIPSLREVWDDAAQFVAPEDAVTLAAVLNRLARRPAERAAWGARAQARARTYTPQRMARAYVGLYASLVARGRGRNTVGACAPAPVGAG